MGTALSSVRSPHILREKGGKCITPTSTPRFGRVTRSSLLKTLTDAIAARLTIVSSAGVRAHTIININVREDGNVWTVETEPMSHDIEHTRRMGTVFDLHHTAYLRKAAAPNPSSTMSSSNERRKKRKKVGRKQERQKPRRKARRRR